MDKLIGKYIKEIRLSDDGSEMFIVTGKEDEIIEIYKTAAYCCASCYIYEILNPENIINHEVLDIEEKSFSKTEKDDEDIELFGYTLKSLNGYCDIVLRTDGNYGGDIYYKGNLKDQKDREYFDYFNKAKIIKENKDN